MDSLSVIDSSEQFLAIHKHLFPFFENPFMYPDFPEIPNSIRGNDGYLRKDFSIHKKGSSYFIVADYKGEYRETLENISHLPIVFHFTEYELQSPHIGELFRTKIDTKLEENPEIKIYEEALRTVIMKGMYTEFTDPIRGKLVELDCDFNNPTFTSLEWISLQTYEGRYVVWDARVDFSKDELEQIKEAVFI